MVFEHGAALPDSGKPVKMTLQNANSSAEAEATSQGQKRLIERDPLRSHASPRRIGYIRVSTASQQVDRQIVQLEAECDELRVEQVSAVAAKRPVFDALIDDLRTGDTFVVVDLDRAFRSAIDAIITSEALSKRQVKFRILSFPFDTTCDEGELFFGIVALFAQFERRIISRRTREGMQAARERGVKLGRPSLLNSDTVHDAYIWMSETGLPCAYVSALLGVSRLTLQRSFRRQGLQYPIDKGARA